MMPFSYLARRPAFGLSFAYFIFTSTFAWSAAVEPGLSFAEALRLSLQQSPRLQVVADQLAAAKKLHDSAEQLPVPVVALAIENLPISGGDRFSLSNDFMTMRRFSWMQDVPNHDRRAAQKDLAYSQQRLVQADALRERQAVQRDTASAWLTRFYLEQQLHKLTEIERENQQLKIITRQQFAAGKINASEVLLPQQESINLTLVRDELDAKHRQVVAELQRFIGDEAERDLSGTAPVWSLQLESLQQRLEQHPDLQFVSAQRMQQQAKIAEVKAARQVDWSYELSYQKRGDEYGDMVSLQWSVELSFFNRGRRDAELSNQYADAAALAAEHEKLRREHTAMLRSQFAELQRLQQKLARLKNEIQPLLAQKAALIKAQWRNGISSLRDVIATQQEQFINEINVITTQHELQILTVTLLFNYDVDEGKLP